MKTIDVKSMLIGFLLCACFFLTVGATDTKKEADGFSLPMSGKYQLIQSQLEDDRRRREHEDLMNGVRYQYFCSEAGNLPQMIDTSTGQVYDRKCLIPNPQTGNCIQGEWIEK